MKKKKKIRSLSTRGSTPTSIAPTGLAMTTMSPLPSHLDPQTPSPLPLPLPLPPASPQVSALCDTPCSTRGGVSLLLKPSLRARVERLVLRKQGVLRMTASGVHLVLSHCVVCRRSELSAPGQPDMLPWESIIKGHVLGWVRLLCDG